jgi:hypothetical protein
MGSSIPSTTPGIPFPAQTWSRSYSAGSESCVCYQLYENVTEGTPIIPAFEMLTEPSDWLRRQGWPDEKVSYLLENGPAPSFVVKITQR